MMKPLRVKPISNYHIWLEYSDGVKGEVDLSHLAGKGVFKRWDNPDLITQVDITKDGVVAWDEDIDLCPDSLYLKLTRKKPDELFDNLKEEAVHA